MSSPRVSTLFRRHPDPDLLLDRHRCLLHVWCVILQLAIGHRANDRCALCLGHIAKMAESVKAGVVAAGGNVDILQYASDVLSHA